MDTTYKNFDILHIADNEAHYFELLASVIESVDNSSYLSITKSPTSYICRITTSSRIINPLIKQLNIFNTTAGIHVEYSKSMVSGSIFFKISLT